MDRRAGQRALDAGAKPQWNQAESAIRLSVAAARDLVAFCAGQTLLPSRVDELHAELTGALERLTRTDDEQESTEGAGASEAA